MAVRIVGIGASAGGLQALESFFSEVPTGLGLAFVVVQHLSMDHTTSLTAILQRSTSLKVVSLQEMTVPEPDYIYVKMPQVEVRVENQVLRTVPRDLQHESLYLPIDDFFFSFAASRGEDAIAIILSGMGTDGSRGLQEIKEKGGIVMVQHPDSAQFDGMPRAALRQQLADVVLPPTELGSRLAVIVGKMDSGSDLAQQLDQLSQKDLIKTLLDRIHASSGVDFNRYRPATIIRRIEKRMLICQYDHLKDYVSYVLENEQELQTLRQSFLIGVTRFFRDREAFDIVLEKVITELFETNPQREIRVWVPACSTGEEVYSFAMMFDDYLMRTHREASFRIFGSDIDRAAIITAAAGVYQDSIAADIPSEWLSRYFIRENQGYRVRTELKENILFAVQNLLEDPPFIRIDLLSCRNFLIYVNGEAQQRIIGNFYFSLNPNGALMLGPSESLGSMQSTFSTIDRRWKVYRKQPGGKTTSGKPVSPAIENIPARPSGIAIINPESIRFEDLPAPPPVATDSSSLSMDYYARFLSERFAPAVLFVNAQYDILYLNGDFQGILRLPRFNAHLSLQTVVSEEAESLLTTGVDQVIRTGNSGLFERINVANNMENPRWIKVRFSLQHFVQLKDPVAMLEFFPVEKTEDTAGNGMEAPDEVYSVDRQLKNKIKELESELMRSEQRGQKLYNELEATNEELQSSNRELLASNEEMQSTNEELQSVNEELYTVNNEFQRKNEELNNTNNDVSNLLKSTQISTIFVDSKLRIRRFTPAIVQQFDLHASDLGRPITSFSNPFDDLDVESLCARVLEKNERHDQEVQDRYGNYYLLRMLPYLTEQEQVGGVVITFVDINDLVRTRRRLTDLAIKYEAIFQHTGEVISIVRENSRIEEINHPFAGRERKELLGTYFTDLIATDQDKVKFNDSLRSAFDSRQASELNLVVADPDDEQLFLRLEILPISTIPRSSDTSGEIMQVVIIIQDTTMLEMERRESSAIIEQYQTALSYLQQDAGLIDTDERLILVNHMPTHVRQPDEYPNRRLADFLSEKGLERYRKAFRRLRDGSGVEAVVYEPDELLDDVHPRRVLYRPIYVNGQLRYVNFEVVNNDRTGG